MIDEVDRRLIQLEMEKLSLRKETRADALKRVAQIDDEMADLQEKQVIHTPRYTFRSGSFLLTLMVTLMASKYKYVLCCNPIGAIV